MCYSICTCTCTYANTPTELTDHAIFISRGIHIYIFEGTARVNFTSMKLPMYTLETLLNLQRITFGKRVVHVENVVLIEKSKFGQLTGSWVPSRKGGVSSDMKSSTRGRLSASVVANLLKQCCSTRTALLEQPSGNCCKGLGKQWPPGSAFCRAGKNCGHGCYGCGYKDDCDLAC